MPATLENCRIASVEFLRYDRHSLHNRRGRAFDGMRLVVLTIGTVLCGCGTIAPTAPKPRVIASYSGNALNSGILGIERDGKGGFEGFKVNADFVEKFNLYVEDFGYALLPPPKPLQVGTTLVTADQMVTWKDLEAQPGLGIKKQTLLQKVGL